MGKGRKQSNGKGYGRFKKWLKKGTVDQETEAVNKDPLDSQQSESIEAAGCEKKVEQTESSNEKSNLRN